MDRGETDRSVKINQLASTVRWWLSYITAVGRDQVLSEAALKFPVVEYLQKSLVEKVELEYKHPKLARRRIDLYFKDNEGENVFEFKYIKRGSTQDLDEKQRIFNDLMRLYLCLKKEFKGYFLICGSQFDFISSFERITKPDTNQFIIPKTRDEERQPIEAIGFYTEWFSFDISTPSKQIYPKASETEYGKIYDQFKLDYHISFLETTGNVFQLPESLTTHLLFLSEDINQDKSDQTTKIGIWEVTN
jgi:hypothetical protein